MRKIIALGVSDPQWPNTFRRLEVIHNIKLVYVTSMTKRRNDYANMPEPQPEWESLSNSITGKTKYRPELQKHYPSNELFRHMEAFKANAMHMMSRMETETKKHSFEDRLRLFNKLVVYWFQVLEELKPCAIIFPITPHANYDYIAYQIAKYLDIKTILLERTGVPGLMFVKHSIYEQLYGSARYASLPRDENRETIIKKYLLTKRATDNDLLPENMRMRLAQRRVADISQVGLSENLTQIVRYEWSELINRAFRSGITKRIKDVYHLDAQTPIGATKERLRAMRTKRRLRKQYKEIARTKPLDDSKFCFLALHYQPERNSLPLGGLYVDQINMIEQIAHCLPDDWTIVVKEHNMQFDYWKLGQKARNDNFYTALASNPRVRVADLDCNSVDLINQSQCVATIAGSVGWQALNLGKPVLVFGAAWYSGLPNTFNVEGIKSIKIAFDKIVQNMISHQNVFDAAAACFLSKAHVGVIDTLREATDSIAVDYDDKVSLDELIRNQILNTAEIKPRLKPKHNQLSLLLFCSTPAATYNLAKLANSLHEDTRMQIMVVASNRSIYRRMQNLINPEINVSNLPTTVVTPIIKLVKKKKSKKNPLYVTISKGIRHIFLNGLHLLELKLILTSLIQILIPRSYFNIWHTKHRALEFSGVWQEIMKNHSIDCVLLSDDRTLAFSPGILMAAKRLKKKSILIQSAVMSADGPFFLRQNRPKNHDIDNHSNWLLKKYVAKKFPEQIRTREGKSLLFYDPGSALALSALNLLSPTPWAPGGGGSDYFFAIDDQEKSRAIIEGLPEKKIFVTGLATNDQLAETYNNRCAIRSTFQEKYKFDKKKPVLIVAVPNFAEHNMIPWQEHLEHLDRLFSTLHSVGVGNLILSAHPKTIAYKHMYAELLDKYQLEFETQMLIDYLAIADIFIATFSSTIKWAQKLHIPTIMIDTHKMGLNYFESNDHTLEANDFEEIRNHLTELIQKLYATKESASNVKSYDANALGLDGKNMHRIATRIKILLDSTDK